jgi:hypothetical protein
LAVLRIRLWDSEGNRAMPFLQYSIGTTQAWVNATLVQLDGTNVLSCTNGLSAPPRGADYELAWNVARDVGAAATNAWLRARARDQASTNLFGEWSAAALYRLLACGDCDIDGLPDAWELDRFGNLNQGQAGDPDGDGFTNFQEYLADTSPLDDQSYLRVTGIAVTAGGVVVKWSGGVQATQYLQCRFDFSAEGGGWRDVWTNQPPAAPIVQHVIPLGTNTTAYYRVRAQR